MQSIFIIVITIFPLSALGEIILFSKLDYVKVLAACSSLLRTVFFSFVSLVFQLMKIYFLPHAYPACTKRARHPLEATSLAGSAHTPPQSTTQTCLKNPFPNLLLAKTSFAIEEQQPMNRLRQIAPSPLNYTTTNSIPRPISAPLIAL